MARDRRESLLGVIDATYCHDIGMGERGFCVAAFVCFPASHLARPPN